MSGLFKLRTPLMVALALCATTAVGSSLSPLYQSMTAKDLEIANAAVQRTLEKSLSGTTITWTNPKSGHVGTIRPVSTYKSTWGNYCRVYEELLIIDGRRETYRDVACRDKGGVWRPVIKP